jgi:hypothetical protein
MRGVSERRLGQLSLAGLVAAGAAALLAYSTALGLWPSVSCQAYPSCLADPRVWPALWHPWLGAFVGLDGLALVIGTFSRRGDRPDLWTLALASLGVVTVMGALGAGFATKRLPEPFLALQDILLGALMALLALLLWKALLGARDAKEGTGNAPPAPRG